MAEPDLEKQYERAIFERDQWRLRYLEVSEELKARKAGSSVGIRKTDPLDKVDQAALAKLRQDAIDALEAMFEMMKRERLEALYSGEPPPSFHEDPRVLKLFFSDLFTPGLSIGAGPELRQRLDDLVLQGS